MQANKKKKIIISVSVILIILSFPLIMYRIYSRGLVVVPSGGLIINGPYSVYVGESGNVDYTVDPINKFIKAEGVGEFYSQDSEILEITKDGKWTAKKPGTVMIFYDVEYSKKTCDKLRLLNAMSHPTAPIFKITVSDRQ